jgi:hypothetical protein
MFPGLLLPTGRGSPLKNGPKLSLVVTFDDNNLLDQNGGIPYPEDTESSLAKPI